MIILRQKSYSWSEIGKAAKHIGRGALIGGIGGGAIGMKQLTNNNNPKGFLIRTGIGAAVGAGLGAKIYATDYKTRKQIEKDKPYEKEIKDKFSWALKYLEELDKKLKNENTKLTELSKKLFGKGYEFIDDQMFFDNPLSNEIVSLTKFIANFRTKEDTYLNPDKDRFIKYNESTGDLELYEGYPIAAFYDHKNDKFICSIKNVSQLRNAIKKYYFSEILDNLKKIMNNYELYGIDYGEYCLIYDGTEMTEEEYYKTLDTYCKEIEKFIKTL